MIPKASEDLLGYKSWLKSLKSFPEGTIFHWAGGYVGVTERSSLKVGQFTKIARIRKHTGVSIMNESDWVYELVVCARNGKEFKKTIHWSVSNLARLIDEGAVVIVDNA